MHKAYNILRTTTRNKVYRAAKLNLLYGGLCPICPIGKGCNSGEGKRRFPRRSWKEKRKTQYNIH